MNRLINLKLNNLTRPSLLKASSFNNVLTRTYSDKIDIEKGNLNYVCINAAINFV
jgi:hypothetical protein